MNSIVSLRLYNALRMLGYGPAGAWKRAMRYSI